jgi:hypothetical protein
VVIEDDRSDRVAFLLRLAHEAMQEDIDASLRTQPVERQLHGLGVEHQTRRDAEWDLSQR